MTNILFSSAGRRVGLIECFRTAAEELGNDLRVIAVDVDPDWSPACHIADGNYRVSRCTDTVYIDQLVDICMKEDVRLIIPTIDTELSVYAENSKAFRSIGTEILVSDRNSVSVTRDKEMTAKVLNDHGIDVPRTWNMGQVLGQESPASFPLLLKPIDGSSSKGIFRVSNQAEMRSLQVDLDSYIAQEVCSGQEYTVNAFYDRNGLLRSCIPHHRRFVRDGEVCFAETVRVHQFKKIAEVFSKIFARLWGNICFQGFVDETLGRTVVFEINARFGGGYPVCDRAGGTYARWILQDLMGLPPDYHDNWKEGVRMLRYDAAVFVER